ncbi:MAG TPA: alpha/beta hydrolase [Nocardioidaceae bacterium]|nr:alpha/beta hydrolase [Nocardioidaceae bacterium]
MTRQNSTVTDHLKHAQTTVVTIPCFSGAPWNLEQLTELAGWPLRTMALPDGIDDIEAYADYVTQQTADLDDYVLVGDSFGAVVGLAVAARQPSGLRALVLSGGFAANPVTSRIGRMKIDAARFLPGPLYRQLTLRLHAAALASPHDSEGDRPLTQRDTAELFRHHTPWRSYTARAKAAFSADYRQRLADITVPTLILTPEHDTLIGQDAAAILRRGIPDVVEHVLPRTGHMFRFTHPVTYSRHVRDFIVTRVIAQPEKPAQACGDFPLHRHVL